MTVPERPWFVGPTGAGGGGPCGGRAGCGEPGGGTKGCWLISIVPLNLGEAAPLRLNPHFVHVDAVSEFCVPQFGQNKHHLRQRSLAIARGSYKKSPRGMAEPMPRAYPPDVTVEVAEGK